MYRNCIKNNKNFNFIDISIQYEALFYKLNLSRNESSPKQQVCQNLKCFNSVVYEVNRYFLKKIEQKKGSLNFFQNFVYFDDNSDNFLLKTVFISFLSILDNTSFLVEPFQYSNSQSLSKIWGKCIKSLEIEKIGSFLSISVSI